MEMNFLLIFAITLLAAWNWDLWREIKKLQEHVVVLHTFNLQTQIEDGSMHSYTLKVKSNLEALNASDSDQ